jgi:hypothetical protein
LSSALPFFVHAQVGIGTNTPVPSAALEVRSTDKGVLFPRVTTPQRNAISNPSTGLMVFDLDKNAFYFFNGAVWQPLGANSVGDLKGVELLSPYTLNHEFGRAAGVAGNYAAVSAPLYDTLASSNIGTVLIYRKGTEGWRLHQRILAADSATSDNFGTAIDMSGDYLVVGAYQKSVLSTSRSGKAYVYKLNNGTGFFELDGQLTHPSGLQPSAFFGFSVAITTRSTLAGGVAVIVGAPGQQVSGTVRGSASVFHRLGANSYVHLNTINGFQDAEQFGHSVDIDSTLAIVGAPTYDTTIASAFFSNTGRAQINRLSGGNYATFDTRLVPSPDTSYNIGYCVKLDGEFIALGPPSISDTRPNGGLRVLRRTGIGTTTTLLSYVTQLQDFEGNASTRIAGYQVAFTPNRIVVGVPHATYFTGSSSSQIGIRQYLLEFKRGATNTISFFRQVLPLDDGATNTRYGTAVAADGFQVVATMPAATNPDGTLGRVVFYTTD